MKRILLTGGAGFIGSSLTAQLLSNDGYHVTCLDNFDSFYSKDKKSYNIQPFLGNKNYEFIEGDIRNMDELDSIDDIEIIIHLAAKAGVRQSIENSKAFYDVNVMGTHNMLEYAKNKGIKKFILASSSSVYGTNSNFPWNEEDRLSPISPYACSKLSNEMLGQVYSHLYDIKFIGIRFFTVYGPAQRPDLGIFNFFNCIINEKPLSLFGKGDTFRDYTYIDDIVTGIISSIHYELSNYEIINLGCSAPVTLRNLIEKIEILCKKKAIIMVLPEQAGDVFGTFADISKAQKLLNYSPGTDLDKGLSMFHDWFVRSHQYESSFSLPQEISLDKH